MKPSSQPSNASICPFHHGDSGFMDGVKDKVEFVRRPHAKTYTTDKITLDLVSRAMQEFEERGQEYQFGESAFRDLTGSIGAILIRKALERYRTKMWRKTTRPSLERANFQQVVPDLLKSCLEEEAKIFFTELPDGERIHTLLDNLSTQATKQKGTVFDKKPLLRGANFITFIKESQISTAFHTLDKVFLPLCDQGLDRTTFDAIVKDSGLQLLKDVAWGGNHLEQRIMAGVSALGRPPALTKIASNGEALQFQIPPHQLFQEGYQMSHFSCGALFQAGNDGYKNLFEEFVLTLGESYADVFATN